MYLCIGLHTVGMCLKGDNGGPLACRGSVWTLVGTASLAQSCGQKNKPGVYTSITQSLTWIHQQMEVKADFVHFCP